MLHSVNHGASEVGLDWRMGGALILSAEPSPCDGGATRLEQEKQGMLHPTTALNARKDGTAVPFEGDGTPGRYRATR